MFIQTPTSMFMAAIFIITQISIGEWVNGFRHTFIIGYYSAIKKKPASDTSNNMEESQMHYAKL